MTLSQAIREGAKLRPQAFGSTWYHNENGEVIASCAIGAAWEGITGDTNNLFNEIIDALGLDDCVDYYCPGCLLGVCGSGYFVSHLNDKHKWSRERIADYVAKIERGEV